MVWHYQYPKPPLTYTLEPSQRQTWRQLLVGIRMSWANLMSSQADHNMLSQAQPGWKLAEKKGKVIIEWLWLFRDINRKAKGYPV